jgi:hypothetical protein
MNIKLGILFSNFGPYHLARIKGCIDHCKQYQTKVVAIELAQSEEKYSWKTKRKDYNFPIF